MVASLPTTELSIDGSGLPIESVTVYRPSGAQVIRKLDVELKAGTNVIQVKNLSSITETESFRVDGLGNARLLVVQCTLDRCPEIPKSDPIRDLKSQLGELQTKKSALEQEVSILKAYGKNMGDNPQLTPDQANAFSDTLYNKILACAETVRDLDEQTTRLTQKINKLQSLKVGAAFTKAIITILADEDGPAQLRLIYRVLNARWDPLYDLYATAGDGKPSPSVSLHYRVNVSQNTGEDWTGARLILSTSATDILNAGIPKPDKLIIKPPTPSPGPILRLGSALIRKPLDIDCEASEPSEVDEDEEEDENMGFSLFDDVPPPPPPVAPLPKLAQSAATISKSPMTVSYTVEAPTTIPSDGLSYKVLVATVPLEAVITHITTPGKSPIAYLQCAVKNTSDYHLLPGVMSTFLNNSYVSEANVSGVATGDTFFCTLGMDTSIRISHEITETFVTSPPSSFMEQYTTATYTSITKLHNRHTGDYPVNIVQRSSIPIASEKDLRIKVLLKGPKGLAESQDGEEVDPGREDGFKIKWGRDVEDTRNGQKEGKFIWYGTIPPGKEVVVAGAWDVRSPVDAEWRVKSE